MEIKMNDSYFGKVPSEGWQEALLNHLECLNKEQKVTVREISEATGIPRGTLEGWIYRRHICLDWTAMYVLRELRVKFPR